MKLAIDESVLRQWLEALEGTYALVPDGIGYMPADISIRELRTALDAVEGVEPVACVSEKGKLLAINIKKEHIGALLYTAPPVHCPKCAEYETAIREMIEDVTRKFGIDSPAVPEETK